MHFHTIRFSLRLGMGAFAWAVLLGFQVSRAGAQDHVWFEAVPASPGALILDEGPGVALALACDTTLQPEDPVYLWDVTMRFQNEIPLYGWTMNLKTVSDSVSGISYEYGEMVLSPEGNLQGYVPLPSVFDFAVVGQGRELTQNVGMHSLTPSATYEASTDGIAWSVFKFRIAKTLSDVDSGFVGIFGETGPAGWADEIGWGAAIIGDNDLMEVWDPGTRYPNALITIEGPQGALWSPGLEEPLYPPDPPIDDPPVIDPPVIDPPVEDPPPDEPPVTNPPVDDTPTNPPTNNPPNPNDDGHNDTPTAPPANDNTYVPPVYEPGVFYPPIIPHAPQDDSDDGADEQATPAPKPLPGSDSLIAQCGAQSSAALMMAMAGIVGLKARRRRIR